MEASATSQKGAIYFSGTIEEALAAFKDRPRWLIEDLLPAEGIALLHGRFSLGKSPFAWALAQSVSEGLPFFGYHCNENGAVLWIEVDEPLLIAQDRISKLNPRPKQMYLVGSRQFTIANPRPEDLEHYRQLNDKLHPKLVVINTLRKVHDLDDKDSNSPSTVYGRFGELFPNACILFIHHDRKAQMDKDGNPIKSGAEAFAGSQAWANDAQVGLHMTSVGNPTQRLIEVEVTKSQVGMTGEVIKLKLAEDGFTWLNVGASAIRETFEGLDTALPKMERYRLTAEACEVHEKTVRRALKGIGHEGSKPVQSGKPR
jgi:hypothetical protein